MKNQVIIQDQGSIPFHRGRPNFTNQSEDPSVEKKVAESKKTNQAIQENEKKGKTSSIPFHKRESGLIL